MFLTIVTWAYKRPTFFAKQQASLKAQTCQDFENPITVDDVGIGIPKHHEGLSKAECKGDYFWIFDDDDEITDTSFIECIKKLAEEEKPDAIVVPSWQGPKMLGWQGELKFGNTGSINFISSREVWNRHRAFYGLHSGGDWTYIHHVLQEPGLKIVRFDKCMLRSQVVSYGRTEAQSRGDYHIGKTVEILQGCGGPWGGYQLCDSPVTITEKNSLVIDSLIRGKIARLIE
jgi:hypothetical protein